MNTSLRPTATLLALALASPLSAAPAGGDSSAALRRINDWEIAAVSSTTHNGYTRRLRPDGSVEPETYALGEGTVDHAIHDKSLDRVGFTGIARTLVPALAAQGYVTKQDPAHTQLLIVVHWGISSPETVIESMKAGRDAQQTEMIREAENNRSARLLGYAEEMARKPFSTWGGLTRDFSAIRSAYRDYFDLLEDVEKSRYYVVLVAYDFQKLWKERRREVLWVTRCSIRSYQHLFDTAMPSLVEKATPFLGRDSDGLQRATIARVKLGELQFPDEKKKPSSPR